MIKHNNRCTLCLAFNKRNLNIFRTNLQYIYENLANLKVRSETWMCFICHERLRQCHLLQQLAINTRGLIANICEVDTKFESLLELSTSDTGIICLPPPCETQYAAAIKTEPEQTSEVHLNDTEIKQEDVETTNDYEDDEQNPGSSYCADSEKNHLICDDDTLKVDRNNNSRQTKNEHFDEGAFTSTSNKKIKLEVEDVLGDTGFGQGDEQKNSNGCEGQERMEAPSDCYKQPYISDGFIAPAPAPLQEIRSAAPKRIITAELIKLVQTIQKYSSEPLIFLQQKNGSVMQLTVAQFDHLQRMGRIVHKVHKVPPPPQEKIVVQKSITIRPPDKPASPVPKPRARRQVAETAPAAKRPKHERPVALGRPVIAQMPSLAPLTGTTAPAAALGASSAGGDFGELDNFEELLPSTTIARQPEPAPAPSAPPEPPAPGPALPPAPAAHVDDQLLGVPAEHLGGLPGTFYLCVEVNGIITPIDKRPLVVEGNQLVPMVVAAAPQPNAGTSSRRRSPTATCSTRSRV